jgi:hypothetical protein
VVVAVPGTSHHRHDPASAARRPTARAPARSLRPFPGCSSPWSRTCGWLRCHTA